MPLTSLRLSIKWFTHSSFTTGKVTCIIIQLPGVNPEAVLLFYGQIRYENA